MTTTHKARLTAQASEPSARVILVDDERNYRRHLAELLAQQCGIEALEADNALQALTLLETVTHRIDAVVSDEKMPGLWGTDLLEHIGKRWPGIPRMLLSAYTTGDLIARASYPVLDKSLDERLIASRICSLARGHDGRRP